MPTKVPTRSPTHEEVEPGRVPAMGLELEDIAVDGLIDIKSIVTLAEDRGRPVSHYVAVIPLSTELTVATHGAKLVARVCAGNCQRYGALDLIDHLVEKRPEIGIAPIECLDQCDRGPAIELTGDHGKLVLAPATITTLDEAIAAL